MDFTGIKFEKIQETNYNGVLYHDYVFSVGEPTLAKLNHWYGEMGFIKVGQLIFGKEDQVLAVEIIRHFDSYFKTDDYPEGFYEYMKELVEQC